MRPVTINHINVAAALDEIQQASRENDIVDIAQNFDFDVEPAQTTTLLVHSPTLANTNAVLGTILQIMQRGGINRST